MKIELYDPHPGLKGCQFRLPGHLMIAIKSFDGKTFEPEALISRLTQNVKGIPGRWTIKIDQKAQIITVSQELGVGTNNWKLFSYRIVKESKS